MITAEHIDERIQFLRRIIAVEAEYVRILAHEGNHLQSGLGALVSGTNPNRRSERLRRPHLPCPLVHFLHEFQAVAAVLYVLRLVVQAPVKDAAVVSEGLEDILQIGLELSPVLLMEEDAVDGAVRPVSAAVHARLLLRLGPGLFLSPTVCAEGKGYLDAMGRCHGKDLVYALLETFCILEPEQFVEVYPHHIEPKALTKGKFPVQDLRVKCVFLPHFQLVNGIGRHIAASHRPLSGIPPGLGLFHAPAAASGICT